MSMTLGLSSSSSSPSSPSERVCYVHCNFCNTILAVSVPCSNMLGIVTVRCGHCANLLSVNMGALLHTVPLQQEHNPQKQQWSSSSDEAIREYHHYTSPRSANIKSSSSAGLSFGGSSSEHEPAPRTPPIRPPEKRQRVPSAYNKFIKEEIQRIKTGNPDISHREAFSTAAKNWAHFPSIHFGKNQQTTADAEDHGTSTSTASQASLSNSLFF